MAFTVILGYDGSACAHAALEQAAAEVRRAGEGLVVVVHGYVVPEPYPTPVGLEPPPYLGMAADGQQQSVQAAALQRVQEGVSRLEEMGLAAEAVATQGPAADVLVAEAQRREAAMIVVGTHGEGALAGALLGSVAYRLVHRSPVPVLVVPLTDDCDA